MSTKQRGNFRVVDAELLRSVIESVIGQRGGYEKVAEELGVTPRHLRRLARGEIGGQVRKETVHGLARLVGRDTEKQLWRAVLGPDGGRVLQEHTDWIIKELRPLIDSRGHATKLYGRARKLLDAIREFSDYDDIFDRFETAVVRRGYNVSGSARVHLARLRTIRPLLAGDETGGFERTWRELHDSGELSAYLKHSLARERILLNRPHDLERARRIGLRRDHA